MFHGCLSTSTRATGISSLNYAQTVVKCGLWVCITNTVEDNNKGHRYACVYPKNAQTLRGVDQATIGKLNRPMYEDMVTRYCADSNNIFERPGTQSCLERSAGVAIAKQYCGVSNRIHTDPNCTKENLTQAGYEFGSCRIL
jgi:hypothetical protein